MDDTVKKIYRLCLKEGWAIVGSGFKICGGHRQMYIHVEHHGFGLFELIDVGPLQKLHWRGGDRSIKTKVNRV
jgi:hypothetical protein